MDIGYGLLVSLNGLVHNHCLNDLLAVCLDVVVAHTSTIPIISLQKAILGKFCQKIKTRFKETSHHSKC